MRKSATAKLMMKIFVALRLIFRSARMTYIIKKLPTSPMKPMTQNNIERVITASGGAGFIGSIVVDEDVVLAASGRIVSGRNCRPPVSIASPSRRGETVLL